MADLPPPEPPPPPRPDDPRWRIDGWPARVRIWTDAEFAALAVRPADARHYPRARVWAALRMD